MSKADDSNFDGQMFLNPSDIVTRLRKGDPLCRDGHIYDSWANEAADEIEHLRAEVARLSSFLHPIGMVINGQAVRNDSTN